MAVIGIDINDVIRDFISQLEYTYNKYIEGDKINLEENPMTEFNLLKYFPFKDELTLNKFLYQEASLEIFGHADEAEQSLITNLNKFIIDIFDFYGDELVLLSREVQASIPSTMFFLSKTVCKAENIRFVKAYADEWKYCDVLVTAHPTVLNSKPEGKISVKVSRPYNTSDTSDYTVGSLFDIISNDKLYREIISTKKIN